MSLADSVKNGPQVTSAKVAHIEAQIGVHEARARKAQDAAAAHRRRATGDGPLAKARRIRADAQATVADRHRGKANKLRTDLAKAKADEAARHARHVKRTVASTAAAGLTPIAAGQGGQGGRANRPAQAKAGPAKAGQPASRSRSTGGIWQDPPVTGTVCENVDPRCTYCGQRTSKPVTNWRGEVACPKHVKFLPEEPKPWVPPVNRCTATSQREFSKTFKNQFGSVDVIGREMRTVRCPNEAGPDGFCDTHRTATEAAPAPTKGTTAMTVSGEAVNIEQTRSNLDQLKGQVADLRGSFEGISGSLASGGLNQLAGSLASADDALDSVTTQITAAEKHLSDQEAIAEAAQAAGEMHTDTSFYA